MAAPRQRAGAHRGEVVVVSDAVASPVLEVRGLIVHAGEFVVGPVDLCVAAGETVVILGASGAGKSLLLEALAGLREPGSGQVVVDGVDVTGVPPEHRSVGYVPQDGLLFPHLDVARNIAYGAERGPARRDVARGAAAMVGVEELLHRRPVGLSGGERQRVALARALARAPRLLLVDEPLGALDPVARHELGDVLRSVARSVGAVMHVTHDLDEARRVGDRWVVVAGGKLTEVADPDAMLDLTSPEGVARPKTASPNG
jgi:ABC-type Fe3+/spermidine/putrescine transport system ATPase subunit